MRLFAQPAKILTAMGLKVMEINWLFSAAHFVGGQYL
jgi:hypothetical protein